MSSCKNLCIIIIVNVHAPCYHYNALFNTLVKWYFLLRKKEVIFNQRNKFRVDFDIVYRSKNCIVHHSSISTSLGPIIHEFNEINKNYKAERQIRNYNLFCNIISVEKLFHQFRKRYIWIYWITIIDQ